jgi:hemerythrin
MLIEWTPELSVGNSSIDKEHQHWVDLLNRFYEGIRSGQDTNQLTLLIAGMIDYTRFHFANEEKYMQSIRYPDIESHKEKHELYVAKLMEYDQKIKKGRLVLSLEVTKYLKSWLVNHIKGSDMQYAIYANLTKKAN